MAVDTVGTIYEILCSNLFAENANNAKERMACARMIADAIGRNPIMEAPRDGVLLHFSEGNGVTELVIKTDPPMDHADSIARVLAVLAEHDWLAMANCSGRS
jgi:hypothetical protein